MKPSTKLEALQFRLTPTRTRCELMLLALDGEEEKVTSGMLEPFMAHLKMLKYLVSKGGYSIVLQPPPEHVDSTLWFTKNTVQRFASFVNSPEILERVINIECEIKQIDESIKFKLRQKKHIVESSNSSESNQGSKHTKSNGVAEKHEDRHSESSGLTLENFGLGLENPRVRLLKTLESRKGILQKKQKMAFARASVSGFDKDNMSDLISFGRCFGAKRLLTACVKYLELCGEKYNTGEWLEIEFEEETPFMNIDGLFSPGDNLNLKSPDEIDDEDVSEDHNSRRPSKKKKPDTVVIRNINFIKSKRCGSKSESNSLSENESKGLPEDTSERNKNKLDDDDNWDAFQNFLLRNDDDDDCDDSLYPGKFSIEKTSHVRRQTNNINLDKMFSAGLESGDLRKNTEDNYLSYSNERRMSKENRLDEKIYETEAVGHQYRQGSRSKLPDITDESSFIVCDTQVTRGTRDSRASIDFDTEDSFIHRRNQVNYEPDDISLIPAREAKYGSVAYDPATIDNDLEAEVVGKILPDSAKQNQKKSEKVKKTRISRDRMNPRKTEPLKWGKQKQINLQAEARARADKLRAYKADLQKEKKLKEEQEVKRLEALKRERQKRIAARGSSTTAQPLSIPPNRARLFNSSKFSDSAPKSFSTFHKFPLRGSVVSHDSQKITKTNSKLHGSSRSVSSLPDTKKEDNSLMSEKKPVSRLRRLSDHSNGVVHHVSSVKSASSNQVVTRPKNFDTKIKKNSPIINQDKSKSATLPELKVRKSTAIERLSSAKKGNGDKITMASEKLKTKDTVKEHCGNEDGTPIIAKTVATEEQEKLPFPVFASSESYSGHKTELQIHAPLTINTDVVAKVANEIPSDKKPTCEITIDCAKDESQMACSKVSGEKQYEAEVPHAQVSPIEDCGSIASYCEKSQVKISEVIMSDFEDVPQTEVSSYDQSISVEPETTGNTHVKGFKKLLKFGRKSHSSPRGPSNSSSVDSRHAGAAPSGTTLKSLISEDDSHSGSNSKATRCVCLS